MDKPNESLGDWPQDFPLTTAGGVAEGIRVESKTLGIEGRTTGSRRRCVSIGCPGWFIGVRWETGQLMFICSQGWRYDPDKGEVKVVKGGEVSARFVSPRPEGTPPLPRNEWPPRSALRGLAGWRVLIET